MILNFRRQTLTFFSGIMLLFGLPGTLYATGPEKKIETHITGVEWKQTADAFRLLVHSDGPPTYTMYELFNPLRIILDVADATLSESAGLPVNIQQGPVGRVTGQMLDDQEPFITRLEIVLTEDRAYAVEREGNEIIVNFTGQPKAAENRKPSSHAKAGKSFAKNHSGSRATLMRDITVETTPNEIRVLLKANAPIEEYTKAKLPKGAGRPDRLYLDIPHIKMTENIKHVQVGAALARIRAAHRGGGLRVVFDSGLDHLFKYQIESVPEGLLIAIPQSKGGIVAAGQKARKLSPASPEKQKKTAPSSQKNKNAFEDEFSFSGYNNKRITVDFFKIDLHNVFRLIGEISGRNIVIAEGVNGTLTLALNEVPWDFVLDVVLNLKDLQKEERFNTIVISPKDKNFIWPKKATTSNLAIKTDESMIKQEALTVKKRLQTPPEVIEAKKLVVQGNEKYRAGDYEEALPLYEEAFKKWPQNKQLANRLVSLTLVQLGMNAKAVYYAKALLKLDPSDRNAALHAAIALANMEKAAQAKEYFDLAINTSHPSSEALLSYAAFCEENQRAEAALDLLAKNEKIHGDTLESMISKARIYDKLGRGKKAIDQYRAILLSGFEVPADLKRYIKGRIALAER